MLAVFFLFPQSEQVYVSVSVFKVQSGVTLLLQSLCRECQHCSGALLIRLASPPDPECTQAMLGPCWVWGFFLLQHSRPARSQGQLCIWQNTNVFFQGYTIALLPVKGWKRWLCWWWVTCEAMGHMWGHGPRGSPSMCGCQSAWGKSEHPHN